MDSDCTGRPLRTNRPGIHRLRKAHRSDTRLCHLSTTNNSRLPCRDTLRRKCSFACQAHTQLVPLFPGPNPSSTGRACRCYQLDRETLPRYTYSPPSSGDCTRKWRGQGIVRIPLHLDRSIQASTYIPTARYSPQERSTHPDTSHTPTANFRHRPER